MAAGPKHTLGHVGRPATRKPTYPPGAAVSTTQWRVDQHSTVTCMAHRSVCGGSTLQLACWLRWTFLLLRWSVCVLCLPGSTHPCWLCDTKSSGRTQAAIFGASPFFFPVPQPTTLLSFFAHLYTTKSLARLWVVHNVYALHHHSTAVDFLYGAPLLPNGTIGTSPHSALADSLYSDAMAYTNHQRARRAARSAARADGATDAAGPLQRHADGRIKADVSRHNRRGKPGEWREAFEDVHKAVFKARFDGLLVGLRYEEQEGAW